MLGHGLGGWRARARQGENVRAVRATHAQLGLTSDIDPADLEALFEHISEGLILAEPDGELVHWNRAALRMHHLTSSELRDPGASFIAGYEICALDGTVVPFEEWPLRRLLREGAIEECELRVRRRGGEWQRRFAFGGSFLRGSHGEPRLAVLRISDITPQREAEESARRELERQRLLTERLRLVLDQLPVVVWNTDRDQRLTYIGGASIRPLGVRSEDLMGKRLDELPNTDVAAAQVRHRRALAGEQVRFESEIGPAVLHGVVGPLRDATGETTGVIGMVYDATPQVLAQREIERLNAELELRVQERTAELRAANAELEAFSYAVSHDLRGPLRAVSGFGHAIIEDYGATLEPGARELLDLVLSASATMNQLIDALLTLSRVARCDLRRDELDLSAIATAVVAELRHAEPDREVTVEIEPGLHAHGDRGLTGSLLRNLLGNAWKYSAKTAAPRIRFYAEPDSAVPTFCVADNGAGFSMKYAAKLFQPFQRLHSQDEFPGNGIGLATVQRIVQRHGGTVSAEATPGGGATFRFTLPRLGSTSTP